MLGATLLALTIVAAPGRARAAGPASGARVCVQPFNGALGPALRDQIARLLRARGYSVVSTLPRVGGTGEYLTLAREHRLTAFVTGDLEEGRRSRVTFLVWDGATGSVQGRWSASASARRLPKVVAKSFWKVLGPRFDNLPAPPPRPELEPAPPMYLNAGN